MLEKMKEIIAEQLSVEEEIVTESSSFKEDLGADSLDLFELVMALEDEYSIEIPSDDLPDPLSSAGEAADLHCDSQQGSYGGFVPVCGIHCE